MFKFVTECWYWKLSNYFNFWDKCKHDQISDQIRISKYQSADIGQLYLKRIHLGKEEKRKCNPSAEMGPGVNAGPLQEDRCGKKKKTKMCKPCLKFKPLFL